MISPVLSCWAISTWSASGGFASSLAVRGGDTAEKLNPSALSAAGRNASAITTATRRLGSTVRLRSRTGSSGTESSSD